MEEHEHMAGRYWQTAKSYLDAAKLVHERAPDPNMILPCLYNIGHSLELFLKSHLIVSDGTGANPKSYGHDLEKMWDLDPIKQIRERAKILLFKHRGNDRTAIHMMTFTALEVESSFDSYVVSLSEIFGKESEFALRYPPKFLSAPKPEELLAVLPRLYREKPPLKVLRR